MSDWSSLLSMDPLRSLLPVLVSSRQYFDFLDRRTEIELSLSFRSATLSSSLALSTASAAASTASPALSTAAANSTLPTPTSTASVSSGSSYPSPVLSMPVPIYNSTNNYARFAVATASSETLNSEASKAIDGVLTGYPGDATKEWVSNGEGVGATYRLTWPSPVTINSVSIFDRPNPNDWIKGGNLTFSDGSGLPFGSIGNKGTSKNVNFTTRQVTWIQMLVTFVGAENRNVGLVEFAVYGPAPFVPPGAISSVLPLVKNRNETDELSFLQIHRRCSLLLGRHFDCIYREDI